MACLVSLPLYGGSQHGSPAFRKKKLLRSGSSKVRSVQEGFICVNLLKVSRVCNLKIDMCQFFHV